MSTASTISDPNNSSTTNSEVTTINSSAPVTPENKKATTHWGALALLKAISPSTKIIENKKFVFDTYYTSAGVSAGIAMSLNIVEYFLGKIIAKNTAKFMEYNY